MAMVTHQMQGSYATFPSRPLSWSKGVKLKQRVTELQMVGRTDMCFSVKCSLRLSAGAFSHGPKVKLLRVSAFKGSAQNDESGGRANGSKVSKNSVKLSYVPKESEETMMDSSKVHSIPFSYTSEANDRIAGSPAINKLFKKWLSMLRTQPPSQVVDEILEEGPPPREELQQAQNTTQNKERVDILKVSWLSLPKSGCNNKDSHTDIHSFVPGCQCYVWSCSVKGIDSIVDFGSPDCCFLHQSYSRACGLSMFSALGRQLKL
ncbi:DEFECTIVE 2759 putative ISOFORM 1-RELATED [Salix purpurea]|uniref:DEFECTIVE 2759 putative ISOFORM 1-RELATED n=1 Tax=Salix purpurea TaxID=77065 RepID=A0A9Q0W833_SALPP|nr:DEFECTIVE 2759 putative ISOFORM 1-RELATED [Salix purpurea]KAJ6760751.1 DEFECTIVE 2759 putative ISOFORM 1-RELATED [Salix purpurea]